MWAERPGNEAHHWDETFVIKPDNCSKKVVSVYPGEKGLFGYRVISLESPSPWLSAPRKHTGDGSDSAKHCVSIGSINSKWAPGDKGVQQGV